MPRPLRISAISFLNTAPLMWEFDHGQPPQSLIVNPQSTMGFDVSYTIPSLCADALQKDAADIGIIPAITYATIPGLVILPDAVIASKQDVRSILLICKKPIEHVRTIATDTSSRTSVVLTQILFEKVWSDVALASSRQLREHAHAAREYRPMRPDIDTMLAACDAALLIGDSALRLDPAKYRSYDLAAEWRKLTGLPFVFAVWALRMAALSETARDPDPATVLSRSRDHGTEPQNIATIARLWSPHLHLPEQDIVAYLTRNIDYTLDAENREGLELFYRYAAELGLIPAAPSLRFYGLAARQFVG
jgi:chorismate dehydratase